MKLPDEKIAILSLVGLACWIFVALPLMYLQLPSGSQPTFWGLDSTAWTAVGAMANVIYCALTAGLLCFAIYQVLSSKEDAKVNRTLAACDKYDTDPVLDRVTRRLSRSFSDGSLASHPTKYQIDLYSLFNYFESIAIGVSRGHYDTEIVRDQLGSVITGYVDDYILSGITGWIKVPSTEIEDDVFIHTMRLHREWKAASDTAERATRDMRLPPSLRRSHFPTY